MASFQQPICRLRYVSQSRLHGGEADVSGALLAILKSARTNNMRRQITGALAYSGSVFYQVLEGATADIDHVFSKIMSDDRHDNVVVLDRAEIDRRSFSGWSMGFVGPSAPFCQHLRLTGEFASFDVSVLPDVDFESILRAAVEDARRSEPVMGLA